MSRAPRVRRVTFLPPPPHIHRIVPDDVGLQVRELPCPPIRCLRCGSCASGQKFACSFLQIPPRDGHPCCSARSSRHQVSKGLSPSSHFPVGFRLPVASACHGAARHAWRSRGRDAGCPALPAQIRTGALTHTAPTFGSDRGPRGDAVSIRPPVSRFLGSVSDPCFGLVDSRRSPALAPATPQRPVTTLFAAFIATIPVSDFFAPYIIGLRYHAFPMRSLRLLDGTTRRPPRSQRGGVRACMGSQTPRSPAAPRHSGAPDIAFDHEKSLGTFGTYQFRRSMPCPHAPLPTLHRHPHGYRWTARGESWIGSSFFPWDFHPYPSAS